MSTINDYEAAEEEAFDRIERKFSSSNSIDVTRATITKEEWELAKAFIAKREYNKYF
jgi:lipoate-protein ligase A